MKILAIETSCDETAVSILTGTGDVAEASITVLGNGLYSQAAKHAEFGGVYPNLAKREHAHNILPMTILALEEANMLQPAMTSIALEQETAIKTLLQRKFDLQEQLVDFLQTHQKPAIDAIAVTYGPGLEPALWVGINFAQALGLAWSVPVIPIDHMEGHIFASIVHDDFSLKPFTFPALCLLVSGGHTDLIRMNDWFVYERLGGTRDDAVGEAFDKVARMLGLPYPGGPVISKYAAKARERKLDPMVTLPRPMLHSGDYDFSFSGLKTAVLYALKDKDINEDVRMRFARAFEDAAVEILVAKTSRALTESSAQTLIIGGGVSANHCLRAAFEKLAVTEFPDLNVCLPIPSLSTDNGIMIGLAAYFRLMQDKKPPITNIAAQGNLTLHAD